MMEWATEGHAATALTVFLVILVLLFAWSKN